MVEDGIDEFVQFISPKRGDPTYTLLKAHLLFEELLRSHIASVLPHADALDGARLTFAQLLAVARASSLYVRPEHWIWKAIGDLNRLRNMLSHESRPNAIADRIDAFMKFVLENSETPLPPPELPGSEVTENGSSSHRYTKVDMVTVGLYGAASGLLGFKYKDLLEREAQRLLEVEELTRSEARTDN
jgi:hypothetical protein